MRNKKTEFLNFVNNAFVRANFEKSSVGHGLKNRKVLLFFEIKLDFFPLFSVKYKSSKN
jgi:hypothetical protein